ncbi:alkaline phosphatase [Acetoanaerobium pronyense]|uniref:Alkaline phosphatase n=1 Tax=Acetoanaerobium pronyense TaxID=1482736 RepID=A0ABS4KKS9_9FIRM|nr:alkaline phosphatase [Acetoanaerobium pronyense]MBP2028355.1 alkaline phosphatase [Acetoanaerobium pronyense]
MNLIKSYKSYVSIALASVFLLSSSTPSTAAPLSQINEGFAKNVIIMIPDGMSHPGVTLTRWVYNDGHPLHMDELATGLIMTHNSDTAIADSAPAGTAMATGFKTQDKLIGVKPSVSTLVGARNVDEEQHFSPAASILEAAKFNGKSIGIIATSEIQHATPADFSSHAIHRSLYTQIGEQQVYQNMDVVFGGGRNFLLPDINGSKDPSSKTRIDGENMQEAIKELGYDFITNKNEMINSSSKKIWGAFTPMAMSKDLVRSDDEPSLAEMTKKAIEVLSENKDGFFLMIEGSQIDWAAHGNQTIGLISEIKAFDDAVGEALKFAKSNKDTLLIVASDHGNGGISIGDISTTKSYPEHSMEYFTSVLKKAKITEEKASTLINSERSNVKEVMSQLGINDLTDEEELVIVSAKGKYEDGKEFDNTLNEISKLVNKKSKIGWTTGGHTGEDVVLYVYASSWDNTLTGTIQNSDIALYAAKAFGIDLDGITEKLFVSSSRLSSLGFNCNIDESDETNVVLVATKKGRTFRFPENKNYMIENGIEKDFNGISVFNGKDFYIPQEAVDLMNK